MAVALDPFYWHIVRWLVAAVFAVALSHKLVSLPAFEAVLEDYRLLPSKAVPLAARVIAALEAAVVAGLATGFRLPWAAALAVLLLAAYGGAIALNLARGRRDIDCGCFGPAAGGRNRQHLSGWLLLRRAGGTLMCHYRHQAHADPFAHPGEEDITAHVDFSALAQAAREAGGEVLGYTTQAQFLVNCGITDVLEEENAANALRYAPIAAQAQKLLSPAEMGELFKVLAVGRGANRPLRGFSHGERSHTL